MQTVAVFWFRRDLRLQDNAGLWHALKSGFKVLPVFIFDRAILDALEDRRDKRVQFIYAQIERLQNELKALGSGLYVGYGRPEVVFADLLARFNVRRVYANHDYEPYARQRDEGIARLVQAAGAQFYTFKDQCIFEKDEVVKDDLKPYTVFTPYSRKWMAKLKSGAAGFYTKPYPTEKYFGAFVQAETPFVLPTLGEMGFEAVDVRFPAGVPDLGVIARYGEQRDFPAVAGTTRLSVHLRFGTVSIRKLAQVGLATSDKWLNELIWRDFYMMILYHFPHVTQSAFNAKYNKIAWRNNEQEFAAWCEGRTGYPIVDAGMRELNATGFMHNRVRMITASFLTKHLLVDWRWGEAYFAKKLLDFDLSANNGGWQWAAGTGCDAAPYFRVFSPQAQTEKFDPKLHYVRQWVPEYNRLDYKPIVDHAFARDRALRVYKEGLAQV